MTLITTKNKAKFATRLADRYGNAILSDFDDLFTRQFWNLADLGRKYGFTRERSRQMFRNLYGQGYQWVRVEKKIEMNRKRNTCSMHFPPRIEPLLSKLKEEGLPIKMQLNGRFEVNNHTIRFYKSSALDYSSYGSKHFRVVIIDDCFDFGIVKGGDRFYVVPKDEFTFESARNRLVLYIRATPYVGSNKRKCGIKPRDIERYREAWDLLR